MRKQTSLALMAALAMAPLQFAPSIMELRTFDDEEDNFRRKGVNPVNTGRRKERAEAAIAKAEAKRQRRAAKRLAIAAKTK